MRNKIIFSVLFFFALLTDQASKFVIDAKFTLNDSRKIIGNLLYLTYRRNPGAAFGISLGNQQVMLIITLLVIFLLLYLYFSGKICTETMLGKIAMVLIFSGAAGNLIDRIRLGEVIDFINMGIGRHRWPVYNLADVYITFGMFILIYTFTLKPKTPGISD